MAQQRWRPSLLVTAARRVLRLTSRLVPANRRREWRQMWEGELWVLAHDQPRGAPGVMRFTSGSLPAAWAELRAEWSIASLLTDARHARRRLRSAPGSTAFALTVMTIGIGVNTAIFTLVSATLIAPPPQLSEPDRLVQLGGANRDGDLDHLSYPNYADIAARAPAFSAMAAYGRAMPLAQTPGATVPMAVQAVTTNFFDVLGVRPAVGPGFAPADDMAVAVISDALWRSHYASRHDVVGQSLMLDGTPFTIAGVAPAGFVGPDIAGPPPAAWLPLRAFEAHLERIAPLADRRHSWLSVVGRLAPGVSIDQARAQLSGVHASLSRVSPLHSGTLGRQIGVAPGVGLRPDEREEATRVTVLLMAIVGVVLLIASANLAGLLTAQAARRRRDFGICTAVGASSLRLARELLAEQLTISVAGALAAWAVTRWTARAVQASLPYSLSVTLAPDWRVFVFAVTAATITALVFGLVPARRASRVDVIATLRDHAGAAGGRGPSVWLPAVQLALAFSLLVTAALLVRSVTHSRSADPGFRVEGVTAVHVKLDLVRRRGEAELSRVLHTAVEELRRLPGVAAVALTTHPPLVASQRTQSIRTAGAMWEDLPPAAAVNAVSPDFFRALDIPVERGRSFADRDRAAGAAATAVVSASVARLLWPGRDPIGQRIDVGTEAEVIGVVSDVKLRSLAERQPYAVYLPFPPAGETDVTLLVRSPAIDAATIVTTLRRTVPDVVVIAAGPLRTLIGRTYADARLLAGLLVLASAIAGLLAAAGVYGVLASWVSNRRGELAVRQALGATPRELAGLVLRQLLPAIVAGLIAGGTLAGFATGALRHVLFGVVPLDPVSYVGAGLLLLVVSGCAAGVPAYRAMRTDPILTLKGV